MTQLLCINGQNYPHCFFVGGGYTSRSSSDYSNDASSSNGSKPIGDVIVLGLKYDVTEDDFTTYFKQFGDIAHAEVCVHYLY